MEHFLSLLSSQWQKFIKCYCHSIEYYWITGTGQGQHQRSAKSYFQWDSNYARITSIVHLTGLYSLSYLQNPKASWMAVSRRWSLATNRAISVPYWLILHYMPESKGIALPQWWHGRALGPAVAPAKIRHAFESFVNKALSWHSALTRLYLPTTCRAKISGGRRQLKKHKEPTHSCREFCGHHVLSSGLDSSHGAPCCPGVTVYPSPTFLQTVTFGYLCTALRKHMKEYHDCGFSVWW